MSRNNRYRGSSNRGTQPLPSHDTLTCAFPSHPSVSGSAIVDTHTHLVLTFAAYRSSYPSGWYSSIFELVRGIYKGRGVETIIDVWHNPAEFMPKPGKGWRRLADAPEEQWGGVNYRFVIGVHPHEAKYYTPAVEAEITTALNHPLCVGLGEIGLDYHYTRSPQDVQKTVFAQQLKLAVEKGKPLTIHTRKAEEDTERIMKEIIPKDHPVHVHCFTDSPAFALRLLSHFPNLHIGITGVVTFSTNLNTADLLRQMVRSPELFRIVLETDAPYMVPSNVYPALLADPTFTKQTRLPLSHSLMIPYTAQYVASVLGDAWDTKGVLTAGREGARRVYGV
ncbi:Metallo-dependent hydrolase [Armillaria gallica]|uniref:Metallo-dependent hydrolase n=1 Tax=Armillaria gallica TaxID=47427 RepID=A0A2H3E094_ARMGA|nr:Metallo-dependent hydrolase [Armillaria gallica]